MKQSFGAIAQLVERFHGMEEARGSNPLSSTEVCGEVLLGLDEHSGGTLTTDAVLLFVSLS